MGVMRAIGRFFGKALRTIGNIGAKVLSPLSQVAGAVAPLAPAIASTGPIGMMVGKAATLAPGVLEVAKQVAGSAGTVGNVLTQASKG